MKNALGRLTMRLQTKSLRLWCFCNTKVWLEACISCIVHLEMSGAVYISISRWWRRNVRVFFCIFLNTFWLLKLEHLLAGFSSKIIFVKRSEVHWILSTVKMSIFFIPFAGSSLAFTLLLWRLFSTHYSLCLLHMLKQL